MSCGWCACGTGASGTCDGTDASVWAHRDPYAPGAAAAAAAAGAGAGTWPSTALFIMSSAALNCRRTRSWSSSAGGKAAFQPRYQRVTSS